ncbi:hypothetical protein TNCV_1554461 [Trichonephila clavipes]|nr:hypothetical protein TNCV_1554461 [Trichonephila clavipes]
MPLDVTGGENTLGMVSGLPSLLPFHQPYERTVAEGQDSQEHEDRAIRRVATTSLASVQRYLPPSRHPVPSRETIRRRLTELA